MTHEFFKRKPQEAERPLDKTPAPPDPAEAVPAAAPQQPIPPAVNPESQVALLRQVFAAGVKQGRQQATLERNQARPVENGAAPAGIVTGLDPAHLSREQRRDIHSRVCRGEEVRF